MTAQAEKVLVLGRDAVGIVAENGFMRFYLTDCCGASAKGMEHGVGCRACHRGIDPWLGDAGANGENLCGGPLIEVFGDGLDYNDWMATR